MLPKIQICRSIEPVQHTASSFFLGSFRGRQGGVQNTEIQLQRANENDTRTLSSTTGGERDANEMNLHDRHLLNAQPTRGGSEWNKQRQKKEHGSQIKNLAPPSRRQMLPSCQETAYGYVRTTQAPPGLKKRQPTKPYNQKREGPRNYTVTVRDHLNSGSHLPRQTAHD